MQRNTIKQDIHSQLKVNRPESVCSPFNSSSVLQEWDSESATNRSSLQNPIMTWQAIYTLYPNNTPRWSQWIKRFETKLRFS